ncbi:hypothetical protein BD779DRAFT_178612 [Infundibulicybe gibba]|nr:hypothetical protein BD779DRAFT_178612 [Infundibulicybe gibba]
MGAGLSDAWDIRLDSYLRVFALVFLYYDHLITMDREIKFVWARPKKPSTYWFLANRYFLPSVNIVVTLFEFTPFKSLKSCESYRVSRQVLIVANHILVSVLMTMRVYALYGRSSWILGSMAIVGAAAGGVTCWVLSAGQNTTTSQQIFGCNTGLSYNTSRRLVIIWKASFAYDSIIFALTLMRTWRAGRNIEVRAQLPITTLLLRDGAIYFAVMALSNLANILTFYFCGPFLRGRLSEFSSSISVTMMSRIMLNLHETTGAGIFSTQDYVSRLEFLNDPESVESELPRVQDNVREAALPAE